MNKKTMKSVVNTYAGTLSRRNGRSSVVVRPDSNCKSFVFIVAVDVVFNETFYYGELLCWRVTGQRNFWRRWPLRHILPSSLEKWKKRRTKESNFILLFETPAAFGRKLNCKRGVSFTWRASGKRCRETEHLGSEAVLLTSTVALYNDGNRARITKGGLNK